MSHITSKYFRNFSDMPLAKVLLKPAAGTWIPILKTLDQYHRHRKKWILLKNMDPEKYGMNM